MPGLPPRDRLINPLGALLLCLVAACRSGSSALPVDSSAIQDSAAKQPAGFGGSILGPVPDVRFLEQDSSLIVKGRIVDVRAIGMTEMRGQKTPELAASIQVDSVLKGKVEGQTVTVRHPKDPFPGGIQLRPGGYALYFLKHGGGDVVNFVNPMTAEMRVTARRVPLAEAAITPIEKLKNEMYASLSDPDANVRKTALDQVDRLGRKSSAAALETIAKSNSPENKGMGYAGLMYLRDYSLLRPAIQFAEMPTTDPNTEYWKSRVAASIGVIGDNRWFQALEATKYSQVVKCSAKYLAKQPLDRSVLPLISPLLTSSNVELRRGAAHALRGICDRSSIPALAQALNDSDRIVEYEAMMGLAAIENFPSGLPSPSEKDFDQNPMADVDKWKDWWKSTGDKETLLRH